MVSWLKTRFPIVAQPRMSFRPALRLAVGFAALLAMVGCEPKPSSPPPSTPSTPATPTAATNASSSHAGHGAGEHGKGKSAVARMGIESLDVVVDGSAIHLLLANYATNSKTPVLRHTRSTDAGATWSSPIRVDAGATPARSPHRGSDVQIVGRGSRLAAFWGTAGTGQFGNGPIATAQSEDGGKTWSEAKQLSAKGSNAAYPRVVAVGGSYRVFWTESATGQPGVWKLASLP